MFNEFILRRLFFKVGLVDNMLNAFVYLVPLIGEELLNFSNHYRKAHLFIRFFIHHHIRHIFSWPALILLAEKYKQFVGIAHFISLPTLILVLFLHFFHYLL